MKKNVNIDSETFWLLYNKYKEYLLPVGVILISILLFLLVIIPQFQNFLNIQQQAKVESKKLVILKNNLNALANIDESQLDSQFQIVSVSLPQNKDFEGILNGLSVSANNAGVFLGDYSIQVGDISKTSSDIESFPSLQLSLIVKGGIKGITSFMTELYKTVPLSEITDVKITSNTSEITILFYYQPFPPLEFNDSAPVVPISQTGASLIDNLSSWNNVIKVTQVVSQPLPASSSAVNSSPF